MIDSLTISLADIKTINAKLIDYEFKKKQVELYKELVNGYKISLDSLAYRESVLHSDLLVAHRHEEEQRKAKKIWRNIAITSSGILLLIIFV